MTNGHNKNPEYESRYLDMQATNKAEAIEELTNLLKKMVRSIVGKPLLKMSGSAKRRLDWF